MLLYIKVYNSKMMEECNLEQRPFVIQVIADVLQEILVDNSSKIGTPMEMLPSEDGTKFYSRKIPSISLKDYLSRIIKYTRIELPSLILAMCYIDRMASSKHVVLLPINIHRILMIACVLAIKYAEDEVNPNSYYAKVGGIDLKSLNELEYLFFKCCNFKMHIGGELYAKYQDLLNCTFLEYDDVI